MDRDIQALIARLLAHRALTDKAFRQELDLRLSNCGLELLDNPYASYVGRGSNGSWKKLRSARRSSG